MTNFKHYLLLLITILLVACNKDDVIIGDAPIITLDSANATYSVKTGHTITIAPTVTNCEDAKYAWIINDETVSESPILSISFDEPGDVFVTFCVTTPYGSASDELKIEVIDYGAPVISLPTIQSEIKVLPNSEYILAPEFKYADESFECVWQLNGQEVARGTSYTFKQSELGTYTVGIDARNDDGTSHLDVIFEVVEQLPYSVEIEKLSYFQETAQRSAVVGRDVFINAFTENINSPQFEWSINGKVVVCDGATLQFTPESAGTYTVAVRAYNASTSASATATINCYASQGQTKSATSSSSKYQSTVYEFVPGPGQFVNDKPSGYTGIETTHDAAIAYAKGRFDANKYLSLGGFGGYIVVGFDHSIMPQSSGYDFSIESNAFQGSNEPGIVWVMQDTNGNGLPDDEWYELRGSETGKATTLSNYYVTYYRPSSPGMAVNWIDSEGTTGKIDYLGQFHNQDYYYPAWIETDSYTLYGTRLASNLSTDATTGYWISVPLDWGYVDNSGSDKISTEGNCRTGFKISNAMNRDGSAVNLSHIDFIKVQVAVNDAGGAIGEISTEVFGFEDLSM